MNTKIRTVVEAAVVAGKLDEYKHLAAKAIEKVEATEPDISQY